MGERIFIINIYLNYFFIDTKKFVIEYWKFITLELLENQHNQLVKDGIIVSDLFIN